MTSSRLLSLAVVAVGIGLLALAETSRAQISGIISSDVEAFFGTQSDAYQADETPLAPSWPSSGFGPYGITGPSSVPPLYAGFPNPAVPVISNIPYSGGHFNAFAPISRGPAPTTTSKGVTADRRSTRVMLSCRLAR